MSNPGPNVASSISDPLVVPVQVPAGLTMGENTTDLVGMHGSACVQADAITTVTTTAPTATTPYGFTTSTQAAALITAVNSILTALRSKGIIAE